MIDMLALLDEMNRKAKINTNPKLLFESDLYKEIAKGCFEMFKVLDITLLKNRYKFRYGNCGLLALCELTMKSQSELIRKYNISRSGISDDQLIAILLLEYNRVSIIVNENNLSYWDIVNTVNNNYEYIAVFDIHISYFTKGKIIDSFLHSRPTVISDKPFYIIKVSLVDYDQNLMEKKKSEQWLNKVKKLAKRENTIEDISFMEL